MLLDILSADKELYKQLNYDNFIKDLEELGYYWNENEDLISCEGTYENEDELFELWKKNGGKF